MFGGLKQNTLDSGSPGVEKLLIFHVTILKKRGFLFPRHLLPGRSASKQQASSLTGRSSPNFSILMPNATVAEENCDLIPQKILEEGCYRLITALSQAMEIN